MAAVLSHLAEPVLPKPHRPQTQVNLQSLAFRVEGQQMQALDERAAQEREIRLESEVWFRVSFSSLLRS